MKARAEMTIAIRKTVAGWKVIQAAAAKRLGLTQPRVNDLLRGRINKFSLDTLINLAAHAGLLVRVEVARPGGLVTRSSLSSSAPRYAPSRS